MKKMVFAAAMLIGSFSQATQLGLLGANFNAPTVNNKENVFQPAAGEIVYDSSDATFWGFRHAGGWIPLGSTAAEGMPAGGILTYAGTTCPAGYVAADGASYAIADYQALFNAIGTAHGGNGTNFNVPDYRGRFLRGANGETTRDPDATARTEMAVGGNIGNNVGSIQSDAMQRITGVMDSTNALGGMFGQDINVITGAFTGGGTAGKTTENKRGTQQALPGLKINFDSGNSPGAKVSTETRPQNVYVNYCIKL